MHRLLHILTAWVVAVGCILIVQHRSYCVALRAGRNGPHLAAMEAYVFPYSENWAVSQNGKFLAVTRAAAQAGTTVTVMLVANPGHHLFEFKIADQVYSLAWSYTGAALVVCGGHNTWLVRVAHHDSWCTVVSAMTVHWAMACFSPRGDFVVGQMRGHGAALTRMLQVAKLSTAGNAIAQHIPVAVSHNMNRRTPFLMYTANRVLVVGLGKCIGSDGRVVPAPAIGTTSLYDLSGGPAASGWYFNVRQSYQGRGPYLIMVVTSTRLALVSAAGSQLTPVQWRRTVRIGDIVVAGDHEVWIRRYADANANPYCLVLHRYGLIM